MTLELLLEGLVVIVLAALIVTNLGTLFIPSAGRSSKFSRGHYTSSERMRFEQQFRAPEKIARGIWVYDLIPSAELLDPTALPVVFIPGGTPNVLSAEEALWEIYQRGRRVLFADVPHGPVAIAQLMMLKHARIERASAVAHSAGALTLVEMGQDLARSCQSQIIKSAVLVEPSGAMGQDDALELARRFGESVADENQLHEQGKLETWWEEGNKWRRGPQYYFGLSLIQTLLESKTIADADICPDLNFLRSLGVRIAVVHGDHDLVYPIDKVLKTLTGQVDSFVSVPDGRHQDVVLRPVWYGKIIYNVLLRMEAKG